jgi:TRAP-type mannitol/chloroaromatic compound transport system permease small subunit
MRSNKILLLVEQGIDRFSETCGRISAWLLLILVLVIAYDVLMRYAFQSTHVALQELEWHLFALSFLLGAGYTLKHDEHVRVDIFYQGRHMNARRRAWLNLFGTLLFLLPFCVLVIVSAWPFAYNAYIQGESSPDPGGLPYRWLLKSAILLGFALLFIQGIAEILRNMRVLRQKI